MLTGKSFAEIEALIDWRDSDDRHVAWSDLLSALSQLGWAVDEPVPATRWDQINGLALVHVEVDHFVVYDGRARLFYDPDQWTGPSPSSDLVPLSFLSVDTELG